MRIITIDREFGSGGREIGKRLSEALGIPCYDQEIIEEVAKLHGVTPEQIESISEADMRTAYPHTIGHRFIAPRLTSHDSVKVAVAQQEGIRKLALQGDCVVIGHCADIVLKGENPFNIFVYADQPSKLKRCISRSEKDEDQEEILRMMKRIDKNRANYRELFADTPWGRKENYHLCINTSGHEVKTLIPALKMHVECWFANH